MKLSRSGPRRARGNSAKRKSTWTPGALNRAICAFDLREELGKCLRMEYHQCQVLMEHLLSKYDDGKSSEQKHRNAVAKFLACEESNRLTNGRLRHGRPVPSSEWELRGILHAASLKISSVLGPLRWAAVEPHFGFGPGATLTLTRQEADHKNKCITLETLPKSIDHLIAALTSSAWVKLIGEEEAIVPAYCGRAISVPKDSEKNRMICIEPSAGMFLQKGFGALIRNRLRTVGIDLNTQFNNQEAARFGSTLGHVSTVDLSSASDTISYMLVKYLLPPEWFSALDALRTNRVVLDGMLLKQHKFSSMGNGFTFELETLIFWGIASAVLDHIGIRNRTLLVYGDDIVVNGEAVPLLASVFNYAGFALNHKKTHSTGYYRESCGAHWFKGRNVTPFYIRKPINDHETLFLLHNNLSRWLHQHRDEDCVDWRRVGSILARLRSEADPDWRLPRIPLWQAGDGAFCGTLQRALASGAVFEPRDGHEGWVTTVTSWHHKTRRIRDNAGLISVLMRMDARSRGGTRESDSVRPYRVKTGRIVPKLQRMRVWHWTEDALPLSFW